MLKLYYNPISLNSRRVWVALLEKQVAFEAIELNLDGDQFAPDFLAINPFHRIPVLVDGDLTLVESLAILDYIDAKYPTPPLLPTEPKALGIVRMVSVVTLNELLPAMFPLTRQMLGVPGDTEEKVAQSEQQILTVLRFFEGLLDDRTFFAGEQFSLAEVVAGTAVPSVGMFGISLDEYPKLQEWVDRLAGRESWVQTEIPPAQIDAKIPIIRNLLAARL
ncbi:MAG: glutathione S-transferase family protein [Microcoleus sp. PH2017_10_PVI_O_A]|nr:glutathione S-transferase family protein [Microcoleus sp. PH2017_10_PVI_O_A]MCC3458508.1 glutathione S-transferase family protein [Microcoleus sp. PH2017_11_PCY_U_A]MCC3477234.1 glutathione S-transferase family protein [Microcoleus sp. PH2017_12_PCY_D_A]MCC3529916.1 glutathione S-transferase family protein [Microcoleus sp. PH2017_21_RUC_O_A]MCC3542210.1 glutathione S-transferase family protein [Microcoleus sp. PH2017_22_RUC_O_B]MCC3557931.1 glutathione S-transferase family protein [Microcol